MDGYHRFISVASSDPLATKSYMVKAMRQTENPHDDKSVKSGKTLLVQYARGGGAERGTEGTKVRKDLPVQTVWREHFFRHLRSRPQLSYNVVHRKAV